MAITTDETPTVRDLVMLTPLQATFQALRSEMEMHLMKEEQVLFPRTVAMAR